MKEQFEKVFAGLSLSIQAPSLYGFLSEVRKFDSEAEILEDLDSVYGLGVVVLFIEPNKFPGIAKIAYNAKPFGILVRCLVHPDYLPNPEHLNGVGWWK